MGQKDDERKDVDEGTAEGNRPAELSDEQLEGISGGVKTNFTEFSFVHKVDKASAKLY